ncbi:MAG: MraY family glycosyltransferase [Campylobacterota bacterium]|nr:MraY family glycosyltransferase [Campylobacterota bacterium]
MNFEFLLIFLLSLGLINIIQKKAHYLGFVDIPNERSSHEKRMPRGAGIGFYLAVVLVLPLFYFDIIFSYIWTALAIFCVFVVGVLDDHHDTSPNTKFFVIFFSTFLLYLDEIYISNIGTFFSYELSLSWFALPFTAFSLVAFTNALNLIDGLDGLAASVSIVILSTFFAIGYQNDDLFIMLISGSFISSLLAFLLYNWHPASIFMGDSGSLTLGFVISLLAIKSLAYIPAISILFIAAIPILDTFIVVILRKRNGRSIFSADKCHIHHVLKVFFEKNIQKTVITLVIFQLIYSLIGFQLDKNINGEYLLLFFIVNITVFYLLLSFMIRRLKIEC